MTEETQDPIASAIATTDNHSATFGIVKRTPKPDIRRIGITADGQWYLYGDKPNEAKADTIEAIATPRILEMNVSTRAKKSKYGPRDYLDVAMLGEAPNIRYVLSLPIAFTVKGTGEAKVTWPVRSLLAALNQLDLPSTPLKLEPVRGDEANFTNVYLDPEGLQRVEGGDIGSTLGDFYAALDTCRRSLGQPPLRLASAADSTTQLELANA